MCSSDLNAITDTADLALTPGVATVGNSVVTVSPTSITADGTSTATVTVQLRDANNNKLDADLHTITFAAPSLGAISNIAYTSEGAYTATYTAGVVKGTETITAKLDGNAITDTADLALTPGVATVGNSVVTVLPTSITADGTSTATVTVQLRDANNNKLDADLHTITFATPSLGAISNIAYTSEGAYTATYKIGRAHV